MNSKVINGWKKIVSANVKGLDKQQAFFVNGWASIVRRFDWLPEMFAATSYDNAQTPQEKEK